MESDMMSIPVQHLVETVHTSMSHVPDAMGWSHKRGLMLEEITDHIFADRESLRQNHA